MREGLIGFNQRGFGMAGAFLFGLSGGPVGVCTAICSGSPFFRAGVAGACLALGSSIGSDPSLAWCSLPSSGRREETSWSLRSWGFWGRERYVSFDWTAQCSKQ